MKNIKYITTFSLLTTIIGCGVPQKIQEKKVSGIPKEFSFSINNTDSIKSPITIDEFFADPHLKLLIKKALEKNYDYKSAIERVNIAQAFFKQSKGALLPQLNADILGSGTKYGKYTIDGVGNFDTNLSPNIEEEQKINTDFSPNYLIGLNAQWEIDLWGRLKAMKNSALQEFLATEDGEKLVKSAIVTQTAMMYYNLIALDKEVNILDHNIKLQEKAYDIVKIQKDAGRATELAVQQFKAQISRTKALKQKIMYERQEHENNLLNIIGEYDGTIVRNNTFMTHGYTFILNHTNPLTFIENRPDVSQSYHQLLSHQELANAARAAFFPRLSISSQMGFNAFNAEMVFKPASLVYSILGNLTAPIFNQHQIKSRFKISESEYEIKFLEYQKSINVAYNEIKTITYFLNQNEKIIDLNNDVVESLEKSVDIANNLYTTGYASYLEVITAQKDKLESDINLLHSQHSEAIALIQLYKALGGGWK